LFPAPLDSLHGSMTGAEAITMTPLNRPSNIFVLGTGRCGTTTFIRACEHLTNYTAGHETRSAKYAVDRFAYPQGHIEADNRLTWFMPQLEQAMAGRNLFYVHLRRDREQTAQSFLKRLVKGTRTGIMPAFAHAIVMQGKPWPESEQIELCRFYVDTVTENIRYFLNGKPHVEMWLHNAAAEFSEFLRQIGAEGDVAAAIAEWDIRYNASS
jgi:hypothetical protein